MVKRSRSWRKVEVAGVRYRWRYGRGTIEIRRDEDMVRKAIERSLSVR